MASKPCMSSAWRTLLYVIYLWLDIRCILTASPQITYRNCAIWCQKSHETSIVLQNEPFIIQRTLRPISNHRKQYKYIIQPTPYHHPLYYSYQKNAKTKA